MATALRWGGVGLAGAACPAGARDPLPAVSERAREVAVVRMTVPIRRRAAAVALRLPRRRRACRAHGGRYLDSRRGCCRRAGVGHRGRAIAGSRRYQSAPRLRARRAQRSVPAVRVERSAPMRTTADSPAGEGSICGLPRDGGRCRRGDVGGGALWQACDDIVARFEHTTPTRPPAEHGLHDVGRRLAPQSIQHVGVLALDHRPAVVLLEVAGGRWCRARMPAGCCRRSSAASRRTPGTRCRRAPHCCAGTDRAGRRRRRWQAPVVRAPRPRARPSRGSRSRTA